VSTAGWGTIVRKGFTQGIKIEPYQFSGLKSPELIAAFDIWKGWCGDQFAPTWDKVKLSEVPPTVLPLTAVVDVIDEGEDFSYRFWGTGLTDLFGCDDTGKRISEHHNPVSREIRITQLKPVLIARSPQLFLTSMEKNGSVFAKKTNLRLPVRDQAGRIEKIISMSEIERLQMSRFDNLRSYYDHSRPSELGKK